METQIAIWKMPHVEKEFREDGNNSKWQLNGGEREHKKKHDENENE